MSPTLDLRLRENKKLMRIEYHRTLLADKVRNAAFHAALKRVIVPGQTTVADIGCGTGVLGFMAARLGARRVYLLDNGDIIQVAKKLARENQLRNVEIVPAHSTEVEPPERVDVVVSETLGNYAFEENIVETLADARDRYLEPGGVLIPGKVRQFMAPVTAPALHAALSAWDEVDFDLTFDAAKRMSLNNIYVRTLREADLLDHGKSAVQWDSVDFNRQAKTSRSGHGSWQLAAPATITGLALWWEAELIEGITLATGPDAPRTHWEQLYLPAEDVLELAAGETLEAKVRSTTSYADGTNVKWSLAVKDKRGKERQRQSMDLNRGYLP